MSKSGLRNWGLASVVAIGGVAAAWALLVGKPRPAPEAVPEPSPPLVQFIAAEPGTAALPVQTQGTVQAEREVSLTSQVSGRVVAVADSFAGGGFFAAGDRLLQIETADYELAIARAEAQVAGARQSLAEEEGRALQAQREWRELGSRKANALFLREPQLAAARASLASAEAELENARLNLQRTSLSLPFNGRLVSKSADLGQFVAAGSAVARAYSTDQVQVRLPITDRQLARLDLPLGQALLNASERLPAVTLAAEFAGERWEWQGRIARTEASIDVDSRVLYAVALVEQPFDAGATGRRPPLTPGLFVEARIEGRAIDGLARLPRSALRSDGSVLLVDTENQLHSRSVQSLHGDGRSVWLAGLSKGDRVVVGEAGTLLAGMAVTPLPARQLAAGEL